MELTATLSFHFGLAATLCSQGGGAGFKTYPDFKGLANLSLPFYGPKRCHFTLQVTLSTTAMVI